MTDVDTTGIENKIVVLISSLTDEMFNPKLCAQLEIIEEKATIIVYHTNLSNQMVLDLQQKGM
jgi:hypothetical protein